jgi:hypothetical protein
MSEKINFKKDKIPFTQIANEVLNDKNLSGKAKGIYAYLYSKPNGWDFAIDRIALDFKDGRKAINSGLNELEANGYLYRERQKTGRVLYLLKSQMPKTDIGQPEPNAQNGQVPKRPSAKTGIVSNTDLEVIKKKTAQLALLLLYQKLLQLAVRITTPVLLTPSYGKSGSYTVKNCVKNLRQLAVSNS